MAGSLIGLCFLFDCFRKVGKAAILNRYLAAGIPLALFAALHLYIKLNAHETTDLIKSDSLNKQVRGLIDFDRLLIIFKFFADTFIHQIDRFSALIALAALAFLGFDTRTSRLWPPAVYTLALLAVSAAYCATFLFTPYDLHWHLGTAMSRLMIQLWPATVLTLMLFTYPLDRVLATPLRFILNPTPSPQLLPAPAALHAADALQCRSCRYNLAGSLKAGQTQCPECGYPISTAQQAHFNNASK